jgi:hypothetical protein
LVSFFCFLKNLFLANTRFVNVGQHELPSSFMTICGSQGVLDPTGNVNPGCAFDVAAVALVEENGTSSTSFNVITPGLPIGSFSGARTYPAGTVKRSARKTFVIQERIAPCVTFATSLMPTSASGRGVGVGITRFAVVLTQTLNSSFSLSPFFVSGLPSTAGIEDMIAYIDPNLSDTDSLESSNVKVFLLPNAGTAANLEEQQLTKLGSITIRQFASDTSSFRFLSGERRSRVYCFL